MSDSHIDMPERFRVALSFSGEVRSYVHTLAEYLANVLTPEHVLYDRFHEARFARPGLVFYLPLLYGERSDLVVVIFDHTYSSREWCGLEWTAIYSLMKRRNQEKIMLLSFGGDPPPGLYGLEGSVDLRSRSPREAAHLVLERLALNERLPRDSYSARLSPLLSLNDHSNPSAELAATKAAAAALEQEYFAVRRDRAGRSRRRALRDLARRADLLSPATLGVFNTRLMLWHSLLFETRFYREYENAISGLDAAFNDLDANDLSKKECSEAHIAFADVAIDIAQSAPAGIQLNPLIGRLNAAISQIGHDIGVGKARVPDGSHLSALLVARSKCRRALANLFRRRMPGSKASDHNGQDLRAAALADARNAYACTPSAASQFELALALFSRAPTFSSDLATEGLELLAALHEERAGPLPTYELTRQLRSRHRFDEAIEVFLTLPNREDDQRRFHLGLSEFASCVIGKYHQSPTNPNVKDLAVKACTWLNDCISFEHHRAKELVNLCYMKAISGTAPSEITQPLQELKANSSAAWNTLAQLASAAASGEPTLDEGLLLGLEDPIIWSRIGTLFADFCGDYVRALEFYDRALVIQPRSPVIFFNKARVLALGAKDFQAADLALKQCHEVKRHLWSWYKANQDDIRALEAHIRAGLSPHETDSREI